MTETTQEIQPYQQRVIEEYKENEDRRNRLGNFFETETFLATGSDERGRLQIQYHIMLSLSEVLLQRINAMGYSSLV